MRSAFGRLESFRSSRSLKVALIGVLGFALLRLIACVPYHIPSRSMEDTLLVGDFLMVEKLSYGAKLPLSGQHRLRGLRGLKRGDIVVFRDPTAGRDLIKRCVALGGDLVEMRQGELFVNGSWVAEPYRKSVDRSESWEPLRLRQDQFFALGDHRGLSSDSRHFGPLPLSSLHGRACIIYYSWDPQRRRVRWSRLSQIVL